MKKALSLILCIVMAVCLFAACNKTEESGLVKVGIINMQPGESGYRDANVEDMAKVFTEANGYDAKFTNSDDNDAQINAAKQYITDGVKYLLIAAQATTGWDSVLADAQEAGVKVFLFDRMIDCDESLYEAAVVSDMAEEGKAAVAWLKAQNLEAYNVVHIKGALESDAQIGRTAALQAEFSAGTMTMVGEGTGGPNWDGAEARKVVEAVIAAKKDFNVIYAENTGMAAGAVQALDAAGITHGVDGDVIIMAFDADKWALLNLMRGTWNFIQECSPRQASVIHGFIQKLEAGEALNLADKKVISAEKSFDATTITKADIDTYGLGSLEDEDLEYYNNL